MAKYGIGYLDSRKEKTMIAALATLNNNSPFLWEVRTDGKSYTIMCEDAEVFDPDSGEYLTNMTAAECEVWLTNLNRSTLGYGHEGEPQYEV